MDKNRLDYLIEVIKTNNMNQSTIIACEEVISDFILRYDFAQPINIIKKEKHDELINIVIELKNKGGEYWNVGEMLERTFNMLNIIENDKSK